MLRDLTVLITAAGNVFMPGTTACLRKNGERNIRLIGADMNDDSSILQMCDAYYSVPRGDDPNYIDTLLEICRKEKVDVLLPIMSVELNALAANREKFEKEGTHVSVSDEKGLDIANDKLKLFNFMKENNLPCADYCAVHNLQELREDANKMGYPKKSICIKATHGSGSRGFRILDETKSRYELFLYDKPTASYVTLNEMEQILKEATIFPELLIMEYLPGKEYTVDLLAEHGKVLYNCCRKSLGMENSIMLDGIVVDKPEILELCASITEKLALDGNIGFDIKEDANDNPYILECNPRITAGIPIFAAAGINLPYLNVKRLIGEPLPELKLNYGTTVKRRWMEMYTADRKS